MQIGPVGAGIGSRGVRLAAGMRACRSLGFVFGNDLVAICFGFELCLDKNWSLLLGSEGTVSGFDPHNLRAMIRISEA